MKEKKFSPAGQLQELVDKHLYESVLSSTYPGGPRFNQYASEQVGKVVLNQRKKALGGLIDTESDLAKLKSDDIKDHGLPRPLAPIKRKRSKVYKLSK